ncbi:hypothetical protein MF271_24305 (plasmid) [Deinococcus sp. KNUC1210]|uniref:hypothetical protein n=1 Tax=Deinococcus sp. KNUC1210 TaxID=2917691 RepID=UPI001EF06FFF|nr:hypothetical protein [Deinococcus sp. KNUC1210]ULH18083.1 hypothetical protein MF271_24305 [Deinococcus sp. KNUC1210]
MLQLNVSVDPEMQALVLDACLNNHAYDPQVEGPRTEYLLEAAVLAGLEPELVLHLLKALQQVNEEMEDHWSLQQRVDLLATLSRQGQQNAAEALRTLYLERQNQAGTLLELLEEASLEVDGAAGLLRVLRDQAHRSGEQPGVWDGELLRHAASTLTPEALSETLREAKSEPAVRVYLDALDAREAQASQERSNRQTSFSAPIDYTAARQVLQDALDRNAFSAPLSFVSFRLTEEAQGKLAQDLEEETDPDTVRHLLSAFSRGAFPFPGPPARLLALAHHPDDRVAERALMALQHVQHPDVRALAIELLGSSGPLQLVAVQLLRLNFEAGDERLLRRVLEQPDHGDDDLWHAFCRQVWEVAERHPTPAMLDLLAETYPQQPCSHCRCEALELLAAHGAVPVWLQTEARLDANVETRQRFASGAAESPSVSGSLRSR